MTAQDYQREVCNHLERIFPPELVKNEWNIRKEADDSFANRMIYAPRVDIAVGPFNLTRNQKGDDVENIRSLAEGTNFIKDIEGSVSHVNRTNPRCLLAIEVEFSGSMKHVIGDFANASMLGYIGVVVGTVTGNKPTDAKIRRIKSYIETVYHLQKSPYPLFSNVIYFEKDEFLRRLASY